MKVPPVMLTLPGATTSASMNIPEYIRPVSISTEPNVPMHGMMSFFNMNMKAPSLRYSQSDFLEKLRRDEIDTIEISRNADHITFLDTFGNGTASKISVIMSPDMMKEINHSSAQVVIREEANYGGIIWNILSVLFPFAVLFAIVRRPNVLGGSSRNGFGSIFSNKKESTNVGEDIETVTFEEIAGIDEAKKEIIEVVDFLKNPEKYEKVKAKIPRGCLLVGPPGVGKTMLAKAIANEAQVPFFACSGSEFVEIFIGMGASKVRELFERAREESPCIIYIDEIDAVGKKRSMGSNGFGNDERDQTLNQLLTEMDGIIANDRIIVLASTNRDDVLDEALLRPGRFDRKISMKLPNEQERKKIFQVYMKDRPCDPDINLIQLSQLSTGFSGADIANLCNEAAIFAAREDVSLIVERHFVEAFDRIVLGVKNAVSSEKHEWITAVHEIGHVLSYIYLTMSYDELYKVTIESRGGSGGVTVFLPNEENQMYVSKIYLMERIIVAMGGHAAEEAIFGPYLITTGASADFEMATRTAQNMITKYGFSDSMGKMSWDPTSGYVSDGTMAMIENTAKEIVMNKYAIALELMKKHRGLVLYLATKLSVAKTLTYAQIKEEIETYNASLSK
jgi:cell division protease FtsH